MDSKKRKSEETLDSQAADASDQSKSISPEDMRKIIDPFSREQLLDIVQAAALVHGDVLDSVRAIADHDVSLRKLFIRGLSSETTSETIRTIFSSYGDLEEAIVILDKGTGKSKGFGFITFKHVDGALLALKEPSKKIDGRMTVSQLASAGMSNPSSSADVSLRKIFVGNVPYELSSERLLEVFSVHGEIEEGPLGFDKVTGKSKGFAFIIYKSEESAKEAISQATKSIDGFQVICKLAVDNKKLKPQGPGGVGEMVPSQTQSSYQASQYGSANLPSYSSYSGLASSNYSTGSSLTYSTSGVPYGSAYSTPQNVGSNPSDYGTVANSSASMYRPPPSSMGTNPLGYSDGGSHGMPQYQQPATQFPSRVPPGGSYQSMPPYG